MNCCGCCYSSDDDNEIEQIEQNIKEYKKQKEKPIKLLLLGTGESGKSTFIRQMRILYDGGYSEEDRKNYIELIYKNIVDSMQNMITAMKDLAISYEKSENASMNATLIMSLNPDNITYFEEKYLLAIKELWNDSGIQACYMRRHEYQLNDSTKYYLNEIDRIGMPDFLPTNQDILRVRIATTGITEYIFKVDKFKIHIRDLAGQRPERNKWRHCLENVKAMIFLVAISEYNQVLSEHEKCNRLRESKNVFDSISKEFYDTPLILFLNKTDLFHEKIMYSHLDEYFPEFKGPRYDSKAASKFILDLFTKVKHKNTYYHYTCATDTENMKVVFTAVKDIILRDNLKAIGID